MRRAAPIIAIALVASPLTGCAPRKEKAGDARASSLVYSPAERLPAERHSPGLTSDGASPEKSSQDDVRPPAGRRVRLHLRRDQMGVAGQAPYPISGNNLAADRTSITGTLERAGEEWLVIRGERSTYWIPRGAVLAVEFAD